MSDDAKPQVEPEPHISEIVSKKGRPLAFPADSRKLIAGIHPEVKSERGQLNLMYRCMAVKAIIDAKNPKLNWLFDIETKVCRSTILNELGKLAFDQPFMLSIAEQLCELKPRSRNAIAMLRRVRLGDRTPNPDDLYKEIQRTIQDYWNRFPKMTCDQVDDALAQTLAHLDRARAQLEKKE